MYEESAAYIDLNLSTDAESQHEGINGESLHPSHDVLDTSFGFLGGGREH